MGDRVSISFRRGEEESVTLFSHWGGKAFVARAREYMANLQREVAEDKGSRPLGRLEPGTVMVDFIRCETAGLPHVWSDLYLGATPDDGDNSDNGHHVLDLASGGRDGDFFRAQVHALAEALKPPVV